MFCSTLRCASSRHLRTSCSFAAEVFIAFSQKIPTILSDVVQDTEPRGEGRGGAGIE